jgi:hypothetical protein
MNPMMNLTVPQTQARLGIGKTRLLRLIREGQLVPANERKPGAQKWFMRFDLKAVDALRREMKESPRLPLRPTPEPPPPPMAPAPAMQGLSTRLASIERKLDALLRLWE